MAEDDFAPPPSPKRMRLEEPGPKPATATATAGQDMDEFDDLYNDNSEPAPKSNYNQSDSSANSTNPTASSQPQHSSLIPGLGLQQASHSPSVDRTRTVESLPHLKVSDEIEGSHIAATKVGDSSGSPKAHSPTSLAAASKGLAEGVSDISIAHSKANAGTLEASEAASPGARADSAKLVDAQKESSAAQASEDGQAQLLHADTLIERPTAQTENGETEEFRFDSSDLETSSSDDSSSSSDSSDEDDEEPYRLLDPQEQARLLMAEVEEGDDSGPEGEDPTKREKRLAAAQLRTKNEILDDKVERPDIQIPAETNMVDLGVVEFITESIVLVKANNSGEYQVLEEGSILCMSGRKIIGVVADLLGRVQAPKYTVRFNSNEEIKEFEIEIGTKIQYPDAPTLVTKVFTWPLRNMKGSDASNIYDEEPNEHEIEFSDDEAEAEHKRRQKEDKRNQPSGRGGRGGRGGRSGREDRRTTNGPSERPLQTGGVLNYDDMDESVPPSATADDDFYTPLARPSNYSALVSNQAPTVHERPDSSSGNAGSMNQQNGKRTRSHQRQKRQPNKSSQHDRSQNRESFPDQSQNPFTPGYDAPSASTIGYNPNDSSVASEQYSASYQSNGNLHGASPNYGYAAGQIPQAYGYSPVLMANRPPFQGFNQGGYGPSSFNHTNQSASGMTQWANTATQQWPHPAQGSRGETDLAQMMREQASREQYQRPP